MSAAPRIITVLVFLSLALSGCGSTTTRANQEVKTGMTVDQVMAMLGKPSGRSFHEGYEAWQYDDIVGFGQCEYITIFFKDETVVSMNSRRGGSISGCGLGSSPVDWSQIPASARVDNDPAKSGVSYGTCFLVSPNGVAVTSHHVVDGAADLTVTLADGKQVPAVVESSSSVNDIAILRLAASTPYYLSLTSTRTVSLGEQVFTIGFPSKSILGSDAKFTEGSISALSGIQGEAAYMQVSIPVQPGNSGGPVVNYKGSVVGVIAATAAVEVFYRETGSLPQNVNWAVKSDFVQPMITEAPRPPVAADRSEAIKSVQRAVCQVAAGV